MKSGEEQREMSNERKDDQISEDASRGQVSE